MPEFSATSRFRSDEPTRVVSRSQILKRLHHDSLSYLHVRQSEAATARALQDAASIEGSETSIEATIPWESNAIIGGKYRLDQALSAGAWGMVWRAFQANIDRVVAIKVLKSRDELSLKKAKARFEREARLASKIRHSSAVQILDFGYEGTHPYLVMEWLDGITLGEYIKDCGPLPIALLLDLGIDIWGALNAANHVGVVHRDLKPSNIMLVETSRGLTPVIVDFGLARTYEASEPNVTHDDMVVGTPAYMCPEAIRGLSLSHVSDVYSMGVTLITAIMGENPFRGETGGISMTNHLLARPIDAHILTAFGCSPLLARTLMRTIAIDPDDRPGAKELESTFQLLLDDYLNADDASVATTTESSVFSTPLPSISAMKHTPPCDSNDTPSSTPPIQEKNFGSFWVVIIGLLFFMICGGVAVYYVNTLLVGAADPSERTITRVPNQATADTQAADEQAADNALPTPATHEAIVAHVQKEAARQASHTTTTAQQTVATQQQNEGTLASDAAKAAPKTSVAATRNKTSQQRTPSQEAAGTSQLVVTASPPGRIVVNGTDHGSRSSLLLKNLVAGDYKVEVIRDGDKAEKTIRLKENDRQVASF